MAFDPVHQRNINRNMKPREIKFKEIMSGNFTVADNDGCGVGIGCTAATGFLGWLPSVTDFKVIP